MTAKRVNDTFRIEIPTKQCNWAIAIGRCDLELCPMTADGVNSSSRMEIPAETVQFTNCIWKMRFRIMPDDGECQTTGVSPAQGSDDIEI